MQSEEEEEAATDVKIHIFSYSTHFKVPVLQKAQNMQL